MFREGKKRTNKQFIALNLQIKRQINGELKHTEIVSISNHFVPFACKDIYCEQQKLEKQFMTPVLCLYWFRANGSFHQANKLKMC